MLRFDGIPYLGICMVLLLFHLRVLIFQVYRKLLNARVEIMFRRFILLQT